MKPHHFLLTTAASTASFAALAAVVAPSFANSRSSYSFPLPPPPVEQLAPISGAPLIASNPSSSAAKASGRFWVKAQQPISLQKLASQLDQSVDELAKLNEVSSDHQFSAGDWLVLPRGSRPGAKELASVDGSNIRQSAPLLPPPEPVDPARVRLGDSVVTVAKRYNLSVGELMKLNPGLQAARMVAGTPIRVANALPGRSRMVLGLKPSASGGLSWPEQSDFGFGSSKASPFADTSWVWPTKGIFTSGYGWRWGRMHKGIDVANNVGTPIVAARSGQVTKAGWDDGGYGYLVEIAHSDGSLSRYAHNSRILVRVGQAVTQGSVISHMGSTGRSTGPHLHFEIIPSGRGAVNPLEYLPARA